MCHTLKSDCLKQALQTYNEAKDDRELLTPLLLISERLGYGCVLLSLLTVCVFSEE